MPASIKGGGLVSFSVGAFCCLDDFMYVFSYFDALSTYKWSLSRVIGIRAQFQ